MNLRYRIGEESHVGIEAASSEGPGFGRSLSTDGGLTITDDGISGVDHRAGAVSFDSQLNFADLGLGRNGWLTLYGASKEAGFSTLTEGVTEDQWLWGFGQNTVSRSGRLSRNDRLGLGFESRLSEKLKVSAEYSDRFSTFAENRWDLYGTRRSLAESYGVA